MNKCPANCQEGHIPLGQNYDEEGNAVGEFEWGACDFCIVNGEYRPYSPEIGI